MKIMHLLKHGVRGNGHVHVAVDLACAQADAGHEVWFVQSWGSYEDLLKSHGVRVVDLTAPGGLKGVAAGALELIRLVRRTRPDVLHAHMMSSAVFGFLAGAVTRTPMITTMHNSFERHSFLMRLGRKVVAVSEAERRLLLGRRYPATQVVTIVNGADGSPREDLEPEDIGPLQTPSVMTLCGLHPRKGVDDVIRAFAQVVPDFPEWHLNIVGWGAERDALIDLAQELGVSESVHFLGSTSTPRPLLDQTDIFATGTLADPCPLSVAEARAAGAAIVATDVGGVPEILEQGRAGLLSPPRDPGAMAASLRLLMADPGTRQQWRARALDGAEHFRVERMASDYEALYRSLVRPQRRTTTAAS